MLHLRQDPFQGVLKVDVIADTLQVGNGKRRDNLADCLQTACRSGGEQKKVGRDILLREVDIEESIRSLGAQEPLGGALSVTFHLEACDFVGKMCIPNLCGFLLLLGHRTSWRLARWASKPRRRRGSPAAAGRC